MSKGIGARAAKKGEPMTSANDMAEVLKPVAPPKVIENVYSQDEFDRIVDVIRTQGPWPGIVAQHFQTVDEVIATISGVIPPDHGLTLDDIAGPHFRGFFAKNSVCFYPELEDIFYNSRFLAEVKSYWGAAVREADADALQHLRSAQHRARPAPRRSDVPRRRHREHAGVAAEHHGQVGAVHRLPREDGADHHLVVPR